MPKCECLKNIKIYRWSASKSRTGKGSETIPEVG